MGKGERGITLMLQALTVGCESSRMVSWVLCMRSVTVVTVVGTGMSNQVNIGNGGDVCGWHE